VEFGPTHFFTQINAPGSSRWKLSQELKGKYAAFFAKYISVEMASRKIQTHENKAKNLRTIYFVFDLDGGCKFTKTKQYTSSD